MAVRHAARKCIFSVLCISILSLSGCAGSAAFIAGTNSAPSTGNPSGSTPGSGTSTVRAGFGGAVYGGQQPITGALVTLWAAGTTGSYGSGQTQVATAMTDSNGNFSFNVGNASPCTAGEYLYITSVGGNPGGGTNPDAALIAALPLPCNSGSLNGVPVTATANTYVVVNEVSTVASVTALQQFMNIVPGGNPAWGIGTPPANVTGMANAFTQVGLLENVGTGTSGTSTASSTISSVTYTTTITPDSSKLYTLANILAYCINSTGGNCSSLFSNTTPTGATAPTDTIQAMYYLATNAGAVNLPTSPAALVTADVTAQSPFQPYTANPTDWTVDVHWSGANGTTTTASVAIDASGNIWTSSLTSSATGLDVTEFNPAGQVMITPATTAPVVGGWNYSTCTTCTTPVSLGGTHTGDAIAIDTNGNAWAASWNGTANTISSQIELPVVEITPAGTASAYLIGNIPSTIAIDGSNNLYVGDEPTSNRYYESELQVTPTPAYSTFDQGTGRSTTYYWSSTIDEAGYVWPAINNGETSIPRITNTGAASTVGSTTALPAAVYYLVADASGNAWGSTTTTTSGNTGLEYINVSSSVVSPTVTQYAIGASGSPGTGTHPLGGGVYGPQGMAIDGSGNLWVVNSGSAGTGISELTPTNNGTALTPLSPSGTNVLGFLSGSTLSSPMGAAIDGSGNIWVKTKSGSNLYYLVGAASPVVTPISLEVKNGFLGERPGATETATVTSSLNFVASTTTNQARTATFTNTGTAAVRFNGMPQITGTNANEFTVSNSTCGATLAIGANCTVTVTFASSTAGTYSAVLSVNSNAVVTPASTMLTGSSATTAGTISLQAGTVPPSGPALAFGTVVAPTATSPQAVVLSNTGSTSMSLTLGITGTQINLFPEATTCGNSLAAGASCIVSFKFAPKVAGSYSAALNVTNDAGTGQGASMSGTATQFTINVNTSNPSAWVIDNGAITYNWNSSSGNLISWILDGYSDQLIDTNYASDGLYMDNTGTFWNYAVPTGGTAAAPVAACTYVGANVTGTTTCTQGTGSTPYFDWSLTYPDSVNSGNTYTFVQHWLVFPNDPGVHIYTELEHSAADGAANVGQMQWVFRDNTSIFTNQYEVNSGLGNLGVQDIPLPALAELNSTDPGRTTDMQNAVEDMHGFPDIPGAFGRYFETKYDNSGYAYLHQAHGLYGTSASSGTTYGVWSVFPSQEGLAGGPTKQQLWVTGNLDMVEVLSGHLDNPLNISTAAGAAYNRIVGPDYIHVNVLGPAYNQTGNTLATQADMYADAVSAGATYAPLYDNVAPLVAAGYVPSTGRGSVSIQVNGVTGSQHTAWAVLSDPATNFQVSYVGMQYWADISSTGTATFTGVVPGTYRLSVYVLGQWGEYRQDGIVVTVNSTTTVPAFSFQPESFGSSVFTIGVPDRSSHEFLHGHFVTTQNAHMVAGQDDREFWGNWNYWADFQANQGALIYYATPVGSNAASDYSTQWNYNHWGSSFDPTLFDPSNDTADGYSNYGNVFGNSIPTYVASLAGASGTNGVTTPIPAWQVYFATPSNISTYSSGYVDLSIAVACAEGSYVVSLNGHQLIWHETNGSDCMVRSGLSGYTQWFVMEWPISDLNQTPGGSNVITVSMSQVEGSSDDAWRMELSNTGANPSVTKWNDYTYVIGTGTPGTGAVNSSGEYNNDALPNP